MDERSFALAEHFLQDHPHTEDQKWDLADQIQQCVEGWFEWQEHLAQARKKFKARLSEMVVECDATDGMIMLWGQRHPNVCASNAPTGECIEYGGRRQP